MSKRARITIIQTESGIEFDLELNETEKICEANMLAIGLALSLQSDEYRSKLILRVADKLRGQA